MGNLYKRFMELMKGEVDDEEIYDEYDENVDYDGWEENDYAEDEVESVVEDTTNNFTKAYQQPQALHQYNQKSNNIYHMRPNNIRSSQEVIDRITEGNAVICELYSDAASINQRVVDYITGAIYACKGSVYALNSKTTFICVPANSTIIPPCTDYQEDSNAKVTVL